MILFSGHSARLQDSFTALLSSYERAVTEYICPVKKRQALDHPQINQSYFL